MSIPTPLNLLGVSHGGVPADYILLKAIEAPTNSKDDESQRFIFDTGFIPSNTKTRMRWAQENAYATTSLPYYLGTYINSWTRAFYCGFGGRYYSALRGGLFMSNSPVEFSGQYGVLELDSEFNSISFFDSSGTLLHTAKNDSGSFSQPIYSISFFGVHNGELNYGFLGRGLLYYVKFFEDGKLVRDFVPVERKSDGRVGMYDKVTKEFKDNIYPSNFNPVYL